MRDLKRLESIIKAYPQNITDSSSIAVEMIEYDICDRRGIKHEWSSIDSEIIEGEIKPQWKEIIQFAIDKEITKLQHQLEIQTKRVENLKEGLRRAKEDIVFFKKYADCPYTERYICKCEFCQDRKHVQAESELNTCQAIDQELEKQLEEAR